MKIGRVVGRMSLSKVHPTLVGKRWVLAVSLGLKELQSGSTPDAEEVPVLDELGATPDSLIGLADGAEASFPFYPDKKPVGMYNACILDELSLDQSVVKELLKN